MLLVSAKWQSMSRNSERKIGSSHEVQQHVFANVILISILLYGNQHFADVIRFLIHENMIK